MPKISSLPTANAPTSSDVLAGVQNGVTKKFSLAIIADFLQNLFVPKSNIGVANGVASLDSTGKVPGTQLDLSDKQSTITASGILKGDGAGGVSAATPGTDYQAPLTIDAAPTANSTNPVQSGGVYTDVRTRVPNYGKGKNLLRNWYFVGGGTGRGVFPVNQRGQSSYSGPYAIDGWHGVNVSQTTLASGYITTASSTYWQDASPEILKMLLGKSVTASALLADGTLVTGTAVYRTSYSGNNVYNYDAQGFLQYGVTNSGAGYQCLRLKPDSYVAVKVELGTEQTLAHQENGVWVLNEIPDYEYELYRCITSTADPSDTYANKSLATEQQLAYVETGTTASRNYTAGEYICWNGLLYTADTAIASGATSYTSGGNKNLTECVGGGFNSLFTKTPKYTHFEIVSASSVDHLIKVESNVIIITNNATHTTNGSSLYYGIVSATNATYSNLIEVQKDSYRPTTVTAGAGKITITTTQNYIHVVVIECPT